MSRWRGAGSKRVAVVFAAAVLGGVSSVGIGNAASGSTAPRGKIGAGVRILGRLVVEPNQYLQVTFRFRPGNVTVASGQDVKWDDVARLKQPHTVTIVRRSQLPQTSRETFTCEACERALQRHGRPPKRVVEDDRNRERGLDEPGDSRWIPPGGDVRATVSAPGGTTLYYLCAIHPWMQGSITVQ
jgi:plastocyanin